MARRDPLPPPDAPPSSTAGPVGVPRDRPVGAPPEIPPEDEPEELPAWDVRAGSGEAATDRRRRPTSLGSGDLRAERPSLPTPRPVGRSTGRTWLWVAGVIVALILLWLLFSWWSARETVIEPEAPAPAAAPAVEESPFGYAVDPDRLEERLEILRLPRVA